MRLDARELTFASRLPRSPTTAKAEEVSRSLFAAVTTTAAEQSACIPFRVGREDQFPDHRSVLIE